MRFKLIPAGEFLMGSSTPAHLSNFMEKPHRVTISRPFYLGMYEVTQAEYERVMGDNPSHFKGPQYPVETVSYYEAWGFCRRLTDLPEERAARRSYLLPEPAEWEYACRAGSSTTFYCGDDEVELEKCAWFVENSGNRTHPVGHKRPNAWGLYDMHGNVYEWCITACSDPGDPPINECRGGSWLSPAELCAPSLREGSPGSERRLWVSASTFLFRRPSRSGLTSRRAAL